MSLFVFFSIHLANECQTILHKAKNSHFSTAPIHNLRHRMTQKRTQSPSPTQLTNPRKNEKWDTFTFMSPNIRKVTNLFKQAGIKIAFRGTNTLARLVNTTDTTRNPPHNKHYYNTTTQQTLLQPHHTTNTTTTPPHNKHYYNPTTKQTLLKSHHTTNTTTPSHNKHYYNPTTQQTQLQHHHTTNTTTNPPQNKHY